MPRMKKITTIVRKANDGESVVHGQFSDVGHEAAAELVATELTKTLVDMGYEINTISVAIDICYSTFVKKAPAIVGPAVVTPEGNELQFWSAATKVWATSPSSGMVFYVDDDSVRLVSSIKPSDLTVPYDGAIHPAVPGLIDAWLPKAAKAA